MIHTTVPTAVQQEITTRNGRRGLGHAVITLFALGLLILFTSGDAQAACSTANSGCSGTAKFSGPNQGKRCFSIFWASGGIRNFCLGPGETQEERVRTGDRFCYVEGNYAPPSNCSRQPINAG